MFVDMMKPPPWACIADVDDRSTLYGHVRMCITSMLVPRIHLPVTFVLERSGVLREFLPQLIPVLLRNMSYSEDDEEVINAELDESNPSRPDRDQDIKPFIHHGRAAVIAMFCDSDDIF